ncbi:MAG: hypothetical protein N2645_03600 [Clostridia bacterium]|nr:hypothetical protein [Clostridia bacterium]
MSKKILTTGILNKHAETNFAHVTVENLDCKPHWVDVKVINWTNPNNPIELYVIPNHAIKVGPKNAQYFNSGVAGVTHYEIRIITDACDHVIVNCFGVTDPCTCSRNQEGNTVLYKDLINLNDEDDDD